MSTSSDLVASVNNDLAKARSALASAESQAQAAIATLPSEWAKLIDYEKTHAWARYASAAAGGFVLALLVVRFWPF